MIFCFFLFFNFPTPFSLESPFHFCRFSLLKNILLNSVLFFPLNSNYSSNIRINQNKLGLFLQFFLPLYQTSTFSSALWFSFQYSLKYFFLYFLQLFQCLSHPSCYVQRYCQPSSSIAFNTIPVHIFYNINFFFLT